MTLRVLVAGPHPSRAGGVRATLDAVLPHLPEARELPIGRRHRHDLMAALRDPARVRRLRHAYDLLHLNPSLRSRALARDLLLARAWGGPAVAWIHGWDDALETRLVGRVLVRSGLFFAALAPVFADRLRRLGVPDERVTIVPPAWSGAPLPRAPKSGRVLFLGRVEPEKGAPALVEALRGLDAELVLAGEGSAVADCLARAAALGVPARHVGWLSGEAKWQAFAEAELLVLPSRGEGLPVVLLEGLAAGVPCLATPVGGIPSLLPEVALVEGGLRAAVAGLLGDPARRAAMSEAGPRRAAAFTAASVAERLRRLWERAAR